MMSLQSLPQFVWRYLKNIFPVLISKLIKTLTGIGGFAIVIFFLWIFYPKKIEKVFLQIRRILAYFSHKHELKYIADHIQVHTNSKTNKFNQETGGVFPYDINIEWINEENLQSTLKDDKLIVKMKDFRNQSKNYAMAVKEFVPNALIPKGRKYVKPKLMRSIDYCMSKEILQNDTVALELYEDHFFEEAPSKAKILKKIKRLIKEVEEIDQCGFLTRIMLREYKKLADLYPQDPRAEVLQETLELEEILYGLAKRERGEEVQLDLEGKYLSLAIMPIAKKEKREELDRYLAFMRKTFNEGTEKIYLIAAGKKNVSLGRMITKTARLNFADLIYKEEFKAKHRDKKMKCYIAALA